MGLVVLFKAGLVGSLGIIIAIGVVLATYSSAEAQLKEYSIKAKRLPFFISFVIFFAAGLAILYWLIQGLGNDFSDDASNFLLTIYVCLAALMPSLSLVFSSLIYYLNVGRQIKELSDQK